MLRNRALKISMVREDPKTTDVSPEVATVDLDQIREIGQETIVTTAAAVVATYGAIRIIKTICNIAEKIVEANLR